jgi:hypothetical protein
MKKPRAAFLFNFANAFSINLFDIKGGGKEREM